MNRFVVCAALTLASSAVFAQAQETPTAYKQVLDTLGQAGDNAAIAGDVAMLATEVTPVLKALRKNGLDASRFTIT
jgi:hypothetical protein